MFAPLSRFLHRTPDPEESERAFVKEVRIQHPREPRSRKLELVLVVCWALILLKCALVWWLCHAYPQIKVGAWWIIGPTLAFATLCTFVYWRRD